MDKYRNICIMLMSIRDNCVKQRKKTNMPWFLVNVKIKFVTRIAEKLGEENSMGKYSDITCEVTALEDRP